MIRQEFETHHIPARNIRRGDFHNHGTVAKIIPGTAYTMQDKDDPTVSKCNYVEYTDGRRAYLDLNGTKIEVMRAMTNV